jgi:uncharacterized membrane protein
MMKFDLFEWEVAITHMLGVMVRFHFLFVVNLVVHYLYLHNQKKSKSTNSKLKTQSISNRNETKSKAKSKSTPKHICCCIQCVICDL